MSAVITDDLSFHIYDLSYQLPVLFHNEVQFRNEVRIVPIAMEHIMFQTSRPVNIPECLSREILSLSVVSRCLRTNDDILFFQFIIPPLYDSVLSNLYGCSFSKDKSELSFTTLHFSKRWFTCQVLLLVFSLYPYFLLTIRLHLFSFFFHKYAKIHVKWYPGPIDYRKNG